MKRFLQQLRRRQLDRDLEDELRFHLEMKAAETGHATEARVLFGNPTAIKEVCREMWTFTTLETWWQDIRYACRTLARNPGFSAVAIVALALGIGANTTLFTVISSALSFNMGVDHVDRMVVLSATDASRRDFFAQSFPDYRDFRDQIKSIASLAAYRFLSVNVSDKSGLPVRYLCVQMTTNGWTVIGRKPILGRAFNDEDNRPDATPSLILSYRVWEDRYGKDPAVLGKTVRIDEVPRVIIGVMPARMQFPEDTDLWIPLTPRDLLARAENRNFLLFGRLADGIKLASARAEVDTVARALAGKYPDRFKGLQADVRPFLEIIGIYDARPLLIAILCAIGFVLLIVCADVANLLLARASARAREISIRIAIGAGRWRIIRQLLIESVLLSLAGGVFGWMIALGGLHWFDDMASKTRKPSWIDFSMDARAFAYLAAISIGTGILFGLLPARQLAKIDVNNAVKEGGHGALGGSRGSRLANLLVVFQMVLCVVLLAGAGLMIRSSIKLYSAPIGVNTSNVLTMHLNLPETKYPGRDDQVAFHRKLKTKLEALPGVQIASVVSHLPGTGWMDFPGEFENQQEVDPSHAPNLYGVVAGNDYFRLMQVQPRRGRLFTRDDEVVVNESFAAKYWPGMEAVGQHVRRVNVHAPEPWLTVVGVVPDIQQNFRRPLQRDPLIYLPYGAGPMRLVYLIARTTIPPATLIEPFRREVQSLDENLPVFDARTLDDLIAQRRLNVTSFGTLFSAFAFFALLLASVGLYAVIANSVSRRTQEIGIRMALGGAARDILKLVFQQGMRQVALGLAIGLPLAFAVTRVLRMALVGVSPGDPVTFASVVVVLTLAGLLGCAVPARRAIRVDPVVALRNE